MRENLPLVGLLLFSLGTAACGSQDEASSSDAQGPPPQSSSSGGEPGGNVGGSEATRAVEEADIVQIDGGRLYAMSKSGGVSIIDISSPSNIRLMGSRIGLPGTGFEMYRKGDVLYAMSNAALTADGEILPASTGATTVANNGTNNGVERQAPASGSAVVTAIDVRDPAHAKKIATFKVPGEIADSRAVGDVLYLVSYETPDCWSCTSLVPRTVVTSFDVAIPSDFRKVDQIAYAADQPGYTAWKRSVAATKDRLYVAGPDWRWDGTTAAQSVIQVLDVSDPKGMLHVGATIPIAGQITSRWQMDESGGVLRVIAQRDQIGTANGSGAPLLNTFTIQSSDVVQPLGEMSIRLPMQEKLKSVRFDGPRAYAITFRETDPLFTIDLSDPAAPVQKGELQIPGWVHHMEPRGDRLIGLGFDRTRPGGYLNVSLFDVHDLSNPQMLQRVSFGEYLSELPEDQNRIHKALGVWDAAGLIAVPYTTRFNASYGKTSCTPSESGIQLIEWKNDTLRKRELVSIRGSARRAFLQDDALLAVSDTNVRSYSIGEYSGVKPLADVVIGECAQTQPTSTPNYGNGNDYGYSNGQGYGRDGRYRSGHCSIGSGVGLRTGFGGGALFGLAVMVFAARRRRR